MAVPYTLGQLSVADIQRKVGGFNKAYKVVTPNLGNRFTVQCGKGKSAIFYVWHYYEEENKIYPEYQFDTKHEARDYIFEKWAEVRRKVYEEHCDYWYFDDEVYDPEEEE